MGLDVTEVYHLAEKTGLEILDDGTFKNKAVVGGILLLLRSQICS
jgi:hypothetical protein